MTTACSSWPGPAALGQEILPPGDLLVTGLVPCTRSGRGLPCQAQQFSGLPSSPSLTPPVLRGLGGPAGLRVAPQELMLLARQGEARCRGGWVPLQG